MTHPSSSINHVKPGLKVKRLITAFAVLLGFTALFSLPIQADFEAVPTVIRFQPAAIKRGETTVVTIHGTGLETLKSVDFSRNGISWKILPEEDLEVSKSAGQGKNPAPKSRRMGGAQGAPGAKRIEVRVPAKASPGWCELRVVTDGGASNSRRLMVTDSPIVDEVEPNNDPETAQELAVGALASGFLNSSSDVDYFKFAGKKGQRVSIWLGTSSGDSRLPGAFELFGEGGNLVASARDRAFEDAVADAVLPSDGAYLVRVFSFGYVQGGPDSYYQLRVGSAARVESVFPPMAGPNRREFTVYGRGLPGGRPVPGGPAGLESSVLQLVNMGDGPLPSQPRSALIDFRALRLPDGSPVNVAAATADPVEENPDNDTQDKSMPLKLPAVVAGRMEKAADRDWYRFEGKKGEPVWIEVLGDRIGTDLDFVMTIKGEGDSQGMEIDDGGEVLHPQWFFNRSEDPGPYRFLPPRDGIFHVMVTARDGELEGGPHLGYVLKIGDATPDFRLVTLNGQGLYGAPRVKPGSPATLMVLAARQGGFDGPIDVSVEGLPQGIRALPCRIEGGQKGNTLVLESTRGMAVALGHITVVGKAVIEGARQPVRREARHAGLTWPGNPGNNNPYPVRMEEVSVLTSSAEKPAVGLSAKVRKAEFVVEQGEKVTLSWNLERNPRVKDAVQVFIATANQQDAPYRVVNGNNNMLTVAPDKNIAEFQLEVRANARAGISTIVPSFQTNITMPPAEGAQPKAPPKTMPVSDQGEAVTLVVLPKKPIQQVTANGPGRGLPGEKAKLTVKVDRQGFYGPVVLYSKEDGIRATVPGGVTEAVLDVPVPSTAKQGFSKTLVLKADCEVLPGRHVEQEVRVQFNLAKP